MNNKEVILASRTRNNVQLPKYLMNHLKAESVENRVNLQRKLDILCDLSDWNKAGSDFLVTNLSERFLKKTEKAKAVLSLGLKFDKGGPNRHLQDFVIRNHRYGDSDIDKDFRQGVSACMSALARDNASAIPKRFVAAMKSLKDDPKIIITTAERVVGLVL